MLGPKKKILYRKDEDPDFWKDKSHTELAELVAVLHRQRNAADYERPKLIVNSARKTTARMFVRGKGIEVGAGSRPFPIPEGAVCLYGDIRDGEALNSYFDDKDIRNDEFIDAQTFAGLKDASFDFVISAHVIEHLENPIGSIRNAIRILKSGGIYILVAPDRRFTFDLHRSGTSLRHLLQDDEDGGDSTRIDDYKDFIENVGVKYYGNQPPSDGYDAEARRLAAKNHDIHFHAWNTDEFRSMLNAISLSIGFEVSYYTQVVNENIFVLKRNFY